MDRIIVGPHICSGKPVIKGTRIMVKNILGLVAGGETMTEILNSYPQLQKEDVESALEYAAQVIDEEQVISRAKQSLSRSTRISQIQEHSPSEIILES